MPNTLCDKRNDGNSDRCHTNANSTASVTPNSAWTALLAVVTGALIVMMSSQPRDGVDSSYETNTGAT